MAPALQFDECVKDSPTFREALHAAEFDTLALEGVLEKVLKQTAFMIEAGKYYNNANVLLCESLREMKDYYKDDNFVKTVLGQFSHVLNEVSSFHSILDQAQRSINVQMTHFLKSEVKGNQDLKKMFDKVSNEYDNALSKHASVSRYKPHEIEEVEMALGNQKQNFRKVSMEYVFQMNMLHKHKRIHAIDKVSSYMHALHTFFHQGFELFKDVEPFLKKTANQLDDLTRDIETEKKEMLVQRERYQAMAGDNSMFVKQSDKGSTNIIEGYLFKRASNAFKTWSRRWFSVHDNKLLYQSKLKTHHQEEAMVVVDDLRLCNIRLTDDVERRFCFEVISPTKSFLLQAESEDVRQAWVHSIQSSIQEAYKHTMENAAPAKETDGIPQAENRVSNGLKLSKSSPTFSTSSESSERRGSQTKRPKSIKGSPGNSPPEDRPPDKQTLLQKIMDIPGNTSCADCRKQEARWASVNLGVVLCIECSGVHRSLGVHVSKVRSLTLDSWEPEVIKVMQSLGNDRVNEIYEASSKTPRLRPGCSNKDRLDFVQAKYVRREYCVLLPSESDTVMSPGRKLKRWKIRKSKPRRRRDKKKAESILSDDVVISPLTPGIDDSGSAADVPEKGAGDHKNCTDAEVFVFGVSNIPDPEGEMEIENSDVDEIQNLNPNLLFYKAAGIGNIPVMLLAKANGANVNWPNPNDRQKTALMEAAVNGSIRTCEFLLLNGAKLNTLDSDGRSPLHFAAIHNNTGVACQFLRRKANHGVADTDGVTPLQIAIDHANADIVTMIRLKQMNEEMMDSDPGAQTDALVTDVFRDFSYRAASLEHNPGNLTSPVQSPDGAVRTPGFAESNNNKQDDSNETANKPDVANQTKTSPSANSNNSNNIPEDNAEEHESVLGCESTV